MYNLLADMRVVEASSFVASPSAGLYLAQMGAEVIRVDQIGGGPDFNRWPLSESGGSFYWEGLNRRKKSVALNLSTSEGRELLQQLAAAPGDNAGLFLTNFPVDGFLSYETLRKLREDIVIVRVMGQADGGPALDYTVNCAIGIPQMTGPDKLGDEPVNHVLPAWDLLAGAYAAFAMLTGDRYRRDTGEGQELRIPLSDIGIASAANLGMLAEVLSTGENRPRMGNDVYGAFGRDYLTADGKRFMIMAITPRQWKGLVEALDIANEIAEIEKELGVSFARDEGIRFKHRDRLVPLIAARVIARQSDELAASFDRLSVCWGPYQTMHEAAEDSALVRDNPLFQQVANPSGLSYPSPGAPMTLSGKARQPVGTAPHLGNDTEEVLAEMLGMGSGQIGALIDKGIAAQPERP